MTDPTQQPAAELTAPRVGWLWLHLGFALVAAVGLLLPAPALGLRVLLLVLAYHAAVVVQARLTRDQVLWRAWAVLAPFSLLMVLPDWFLAAELGVLVFPDTGGPFIGAVPVAMAGMWTIALLPVVLVAWTVAARRGLPAGTAAAAIVGGLLFYAAELVAPSIPLWEPVGVALIGGVALYVLPPEVVLSVAAYLLVVAAFRLPRWAVAFLTVLLPFTYLGMLASSYQFLG